MSQNEEGRLEGKILIVDDDPLNLMIVKDSLDEMFELSFAINGEDAIDKVETFDPDIILLDIMMPTLDGYQVTKRIREENPESHVKIILVSARMNLTDRLDGYEVGADDYLTKPFDDAELLAKINVFLKLKKMEDKMLDANLNLENLNSSLAEQVEIRSKQLLEAEKLSSIGKHAAGIVHNLNNPLGAIIGYSQLIQMNPIAKDNPNLMKWVSKILLSSENMKDIISSILQKGKQESSDNEKDVNINELLELQIDILGADSFFKNKVDLTTNFGTLPNIKGVFVHFSQSIGNIINNAVDSMYDSQIRKLKLETKFEFGFIKIIVQDTGEGISKENMEKIFDPFFTTKSMDQNASRPSGTGLGMPSCKKMLEAYKGEIQIESVVGEGTTITILIPA